MKRIVILTGSELRHSFFRKYIALSDEIEVLGAYCEGTEKSLHSIISSEHVKDQREKHLAARTQSEIDFFALFDGSVKDESNPIFIPKGDVDLAEHAEAIIDLNPDLVISYGCSIIKEPLLSAFSGRFVNVHLGLSPYYRGSGTNYWPFVNNEPEYAGATFMYIDAGVDTGEIIHQMRARVVWGDTSVQIGNRLILEMSDVFKKIIINFDSLEKLKQISVPENVKVYKNNNYTEESVLTLYDNFEKGLIDKYIQEQQSRCNNVPILTNPAISN